MADSWFNRFRRVLTRWEKRADWYPGFVQLAACLITYRNATADRAIGTPGDGMR